MSRRSSSRSVAFVLFVAGLVAACGGFPIANDWLHGPAHVFGPEVIEVSITVSRLDGVGATLASTLGSVPSPPRDVQGSALAGLVGLDDVRVRTQRILVGDERIAIAEYTRPRGRSGREDPRSNDLDFQHLALVVRDIDRAYARILERGFSFISVGGVQTIPQSNPAAGGVRAVYFRDSDGHALELIWYPDGKGDPRWQQQGGPLFMGIDHTAIAVRDTQRSLAFYQGLVGLQIAGTSLNEGLEQERLSGVAGARVRITGLRGAGGLGVELLEYLSPGPGRPPRKDRAPNDLDYYETTIRVNRLELLRARLDAAGVEFISRGISPCESCEGGGPAVIVRDPDGHAVRFVTREEEG